MTLTNLFLYFLLVLMPLGNLTRFSFGSIAFTINDIALPALLISWLLLVLLKRKKILIPPRFGFVFMFVLWAGITLLASLRFLGMNELIISSLYLVRWTEYVSVFVIVYNEIKAEKVETPGAPTAAISVLSTRIIQILICGQLLFIFLGFVQFILFPNFSQYVQHGWDPHYYRLLSTFLDPNFAGAFIILGAILSVCLLLFVKQLPISKWLLISLAVFGSVAIVITFSRSTYLAYVTAVGLLGILRSRKLLLIFTLFGILSFLFIPRVQTRIIGAIELDETVQARLSDYEETFSIIQKNPILGVGFNTFRYAQDEAGYFRDDRGVNSSGGHSGAGADSSLLLILATTGFIGLILYVLFYAVFVIDAWQFYCDKNSKPYLRALGLTIFVSAGALMAHSQFVNSLLYPWIMLWIWIILGILYGEKETK